MKDKKQETKSGEVSPKENKPVTLVSSSKNTALVQWLEGDLLTRAYIPLSELVPDTSKGGMSVDVETLDKGLVDVGDFEQKIAAAMKDVTPAMIADTLHRAGLWTVEDVNNDPNKAISALQRALKIGLSVLRTENK